MCCRDRGTPPDSTVPGCALSRPPRSYLRIVEPAPSTLGMENPYILNPGKLRTVSTRRPSVRNRSRRSPLPLPRTARSPRRGKRRLRELLPLQRVHLVRMLHHHVQRVSAASGRAPSRSILLLLLLLRTAKCHARVHSGRKSAHRAQDAFRAADVFVCPDDRSRLGAGSTRCTQRAPPAGRYPAGVLDTVQRPIGSPMWKRATPAYSATSAAHAY